MTDEKDLRREAKAIWSALRRERRNRGRLFGAQELAVSAELIAGFANDLKELAVRAATIEPETAAESSAKSPASPKAKRKSKKPNP